MRTILITWELGGGLGHLVHLRGVVKKFAERGQRVFLALKDLAKAQRVFGGLGVEFLQAPTRTSLPGRPIAVRTFAHLLHNSGFSDVDELAATVAAWRHLFRYVKPDLLACEHRTNQTTEGAEPAGHSRPNRKLDAFLPNR